VACLAPGSASEQHGEQIGPAPQLKVGVQVVPEGQSLFWAHDCAVSQ
jgi:hypothetical protein